jgi:hypothetical protein
MMITPFLLVNDCSQKKENICGQREHREQTISKRS